MAKDEVSMPEEPRKPFKDVVVERLTALSSRVKNNAVIKHSLDNLIKAIAIDEKAIAIDDEIPPTHVQDRFIHLTTYQHLPEELVRLRVNNHITEEQFIKDMNRLAIAFKKIVDDSDQVSAAYDDCKMLANEINKIKGPDPWSQLGGAIHQAREDAQKATVNEDNEVEDAYVDALEKLYQQIEEIMAINKKEMETQLVAPDPNYLPILLRTIIKEIAKEKEKSFFNPTRRFETKELTEAVKTLSQVLDDPYGIALEDKLHDLENKLGAYSPELKKALWIMGFAVALAAAVAVSVFIPPLAPVFGYVLLAHFSVIPSISVGMIMMNVANGIAVHFSLKAIWGAAQEKRYLNVRQELEEKIRDLSSKAEEGIEFETLKHARGMLQILDGMKQTGVGVIGGKNINLAMLSNGLQIIKDALDNDPVALKKLEHFEEKIHQTDIEQLSSTITHYTRLSSPLTRAFYVAVGVIGTAGLVAYASPSMMLNMANQMVSPMMNLLIGVAMGFPSGHLAEYLKDNIQNPRRIAADIMGLPLKILDGLKTGGSSFVLSAVTAVSAASIGAVVAIQTLFSKAASTKNADQQVVSPEKQQEAPDALTIKNNAFKQAYDKITAPPSAELDKPAVDENLTTTHPLHN